MNIQKKENENRNKTHKETNKSSNSNDGVGVLTSVSEPIIVRVCRNLGNQSFFEES